MTKSCGFFLTGVFALALIANGCGRHTATTQGQFAPRVEEYATLEGITNGVPVWSFSNLTYIYGVSPDLMPGQVMQEGNVHPAVKIKPKKSWEIKYNLAGSESEMTVHNASNDSQPMLPIHLIDGDPETMWTSLEYMSPDARPEWIRIDLPVETEIVSMALVARKRTRYGTYGRALPKELEVKTSRDAAHWETVYAGKDLAPEQPVLNIKFRPHPAKQIWVIGNGLAPVAGRYAFSVGKLEVRDPAGNNVALVSRGANVTVSSTSYVMLNDRFTQQALWGPLNYDLGNKWVRIGGDNGSFMWHYVEHEKGKLQIDPAADESITQLVRHGIQVILNLDWKGNWIYMNPPRKTNWAEARFREINDGYNDPPGPADQNPEMYQGYLRYIEYMVQHFKDRVTLFEVGNEWNLSPMDAEHYMKTYFEPSYKIIKRVAPNARVMLGSPGGYQKQMILGCLGAKWKSGLEGGKLLLDAAKVTGGSAAAAGALTIRPDARLKDGTVSVDALNKGQPGIVLRFKDVNTYLAGLYSASDHSISIYEVKGRNWGKPLVTTKAPEFGPEIKLSASAHGPLVTLTVSGGGRSVSTSATVESLADSGAVGLLHHGGKGPQLFGNFEAADAEGGAVFRGSFEGPDGTVPAGWKYLSGGPNPIAPGAGPRLDAIGWHPIDEPNAEYFASVRDFQNECRKLGFKGEFFATEIYADSMYPPGPSKHYAYYRCSETQMAKFLVKSLVGHSGVGMEAGPCHPHFTAFSHPQALCQTTWGMQTLHPCRPTMSYYMWRTVATVMDDFHPADFPVTFSEAKGLLFFTFQRGGNERMIGVWIDGQEQKDGVAQIKADVTFPGFQAAQASVVDLMNGTGQPLDYAASNGGTTLKGMLIKDYPVFIKVRQ